MSAPPDLPRDAGSHHAVFLAAFRRGLDAGGLPPGVTAPAPEEAARRFAVYRNNVVHGLTQALGRRFPVVERLVGPAFFAAMARVFVAAHPPRTPVLLRYGEAFPDFLAGFPPVAHLPYLADVARLELARGAAYHAADAAPLDPEALRTAGPRTRLRLHPSLRLLRSDWPVVAIWAANQPGGTGTPSDRGPQVALVARDPALRVQVQAIGGAEAAFVEALARDATLAQAQEDGCRADPAFGIAPALARLIAQGLIVGAQEAPRARDVSGRLGTPGAGTFPTGTPPTGTRAAAPDAPAPADASGATAHRSGEGRHVDDAGSAEGPAPEDDPLERCDPSGPESFPTPARDGLRRPPPLSQPQEDPA